MINFLISFRDFYIIDSTNQTPDSPINLAINLCKGIGYIFMGNLYDNVHKPQKLTFIMLILLAIFTCLVSSISLFPKIFFSKVILNSSVVSFLGGEYQLILAWTGGSFCHSNRSNKIRWWLFCELNFQSCKFYPRSTRWATHSCDWQRRWWRLGSNLSAGKYQSIWNWSKCSQVKPNQISWLICFCLLWLFIQVTIACLVILYNWFPYYLRGFIVSVWQAIYLLCPLIIALGGNIDIGNYYVSPSFPISSNYCFNHDTLIIIIFQFFFLKYLNCSH